MVVVTIRVTDSRLERPTHTDGAHWELHDGYLEVCRDDGSPVATYAPGGWTSVELR